MRISIKFWLRSGVTNLFSNEMIHIILNFADKWKLQLILFPVPKYKYITKD